MLRFEKGDMVESTCRVFCQQVNCKGVMGSGLAKQIREYYPEVYHEYKRFCDNGDARLGEIQFVRTHDYRICVNMFSQYSYGRNARYTNYDAFKKCLDKLTEKFREAPSKTEIVFPYHIGCGYGGGDWDTILNMLSAFSETIPCDVTIMEKEDYAG